VTAFDDNVDAMELVEDHAKAVVELEKAQASKVLKVYGDVAANLRQRLAALPKDRFTAQTVRVTLVQLEGAIVALEDKLNGTISDGSSAMVNRGIRDLVAEVDAFNTEFEGAAQPVNIDLITAAIDVKARLINNYQASIEAYGAGLRKSISNGLMSMVVERVGPEEMYRRLVEDDAIGSFFDGEAWKVRRIVRTELAGMYGSAKLSSLERIAEDQPLMRKTLYNPKDNRTADDSLYIQGLIDAGTVSGRNLALRPAVDAFFKYQWKGKTRAFLAPPDRPNDRSVLIPYHPSWE
jgi:hypothetical protein